MRIAVITEQNETYVEFPPDVFVDLLETYFEKSGSIKEAMEAVIIDLKQQTLYK